MKLRVARKVLVQGRSEDRDRPGRASRYELGARRIVLRHWSRLAFPGGCFSEEGEKEAHADMRALNAQQARRDAFLAKEGAC
jgi:hypothetical protein